MIENIVGPDAETEVNEEGGKQSHVPVRFDLIDAKAIFEMAAVLHEGAEKYGADNWRLIPVEDHLNHLIMHAYAYLAGDRSDEHLSHMMCRATFAQAVAITDEEDSMSSPDMLDDIISHEEGDTASPSIHDRTGLVPDTWDQYWWEQYYPIPVRTERGKES